MSIAVTDVMKRKDDQITADVDGEVVMMSIEQGEYYGLDTIGSRIWGLYSEPKTIEQVVDTLINEYDVDRESCINDVMLFVEKLVAKDLIVKINT